MIDICMLSCNKARLTRTSIEEIARRTQTPYRLLVLDNGSVDESPEILTELRERGHLYWNTNRRENKGVHWGHNELLNGAQSEPYYICTDSDIVPQNSAPDWLAQLIDLAERHPEYASISLRPHVFIGDSAQQMFKDAAEVVERNWMGAWLRIMRTEVVREVGGWNRKRIAPERNNEEKWIGRALRKAGWKVGVARDIHCIHLWGDPDKYDEDPWGYPPGIPHGHRDVWPPVHVYNWDRQGVDWETCQ